MAEQALAGAYAEKAREALRAQMAADLRALDAFAEKFGGEEFTFCIPLLGGVPAARLGRPIGEVRESRRAILNAVDRLFTGG